MLNKIGKMQNLKTIWLNMANSSKSEEKKIPFSSTFLDMTGIIVQLSRKKNFPRQLQVRI
jgi:hypothetical protein